ncbi:MAG: N-acetyltransferase family protein [Methylocystaceae bacterium]
MDIDKIISLQDLVVTGINDRDSFYPLDRDEVNGLLDQRGISLGAFNSENELIGYAAACYPGKSAANLGLDSGISAADLHRVAHLEVGIVHPDFRGQGWQSSLYQELIKLTLKQGGYRYILSTVAPDNYPALCNSLRLKLYISRILVKYGGKLRFILLRDLEETVNIDLDTVVKCQPTNIELQQYLLAKGYCGFDIERGIEQTLISYGLKKRLT